MEKGQLLAKLEKNIKEWKTIEENLSLIQLAIYQKNIKNIKEEKINEIKKYFNNQLNYYHQNVLEYQKDINLIIERYTNQIDELIKIYDYLYINTYKSMQKAINNQVIAIGNIVKLWNSRNQMKNEEIQPINSKITAVLQKKVNYSVIVEECKARLEWCIENCTNDMNEIFQNNFYQLEVYKDGFWENIKRKILNLINGKKKFLDVLSKYNKENLKQISDNNNAEIFKVFTIATGISEQIKNVEQQIANQYEMAMKNI